MERSDCMEKMVAAGIVAEYNPFHNGHAYQIETTRAAGATHIVAVLSGNFVQRGGPACAPKSVRANAAIACGADLVLELPLPYAMATAERFAAGAVGLLGALGCEGIALVMDKGIIRQYDTPKKLYDEPADTFVAGFIGSPQMNFFDARLQKTGTGYQVAVAGAVMPLSDRIQQKLAEKGYGDRDVILGIRPEHIAFALTPGEHFVAAKVDVSEMMGSEIHLHVTTQDSKDVVLRVPTTELSEELRGGLGYGTPIYFTFREDLVHLFDPKSEENLL